MPNLNRVEVLKAKLTVVLPCVTVTEFGTERVLVEELSVTAKPLPEAGPESVTVQVPEPPARTFCGEQVSPAKDTGTGAREIWTDLTAPPRAAVSVAVCADEQCPRWQQSSQIRFQPGQ